MFLLYVRIISNTVFLIVQRHSTPIIKYVLLSHWYIAQYSFWLILTVLLISWLFLMSTSAAGVNIFNCPFCVTIITTATYIFKCHAHSWMIVTCKNQWDALKVDQIEIWKNQKKFDKMCAQFHPVIPKCYN